jgi:hypothetical protein
MLRLLVKVVPGAGREGIAGWMGDRLKLKVTAPPEKGKANEAVVDLLAETLGVPRARVRIVSGGSSPFKTVEADIPDPEAALRRLPPRD